MGCHLRNAIPNTRNGERSAPSIALGDPHSQEGPWRVLFRTQLLLQISEPTIYALGLDVRERLVVGAGRAAIGATHPVRLGQDVATIHLVPKAVEPEARFRLSFRVQRLLQLPNRKRQSS